MTSILHHPPGEPALTVHRWQVRLCRGNLCAAMLLALLEHGHNMRHHQNLENAIGRRLAEASGEFYRRRDGYWQLYDLEALKERLLDLFDEEEIYKAVRFLREEGLVLVRAHTRSPSLRQGAFYLLQVARIQHLLGSNYVVGDDPVLPNPATDRIGEEITG